MTRWRFVGSWLELAVELASGNPLVRLGLDMVRHFAGVHFGLELVSSGKSITFSFFLFCWGVIEDYQEHVHVWFWR